MTRVPANRYVTFLSIAAAGLAVDLGTKHAVFAHFGHVAGRGTQPWLEGWVTFRLFTSFNEGALWGVGQGYAWLFAALSLLAVGGVLYWLFMRGAAISWWLTVSLALIMAGTLGNLYDRLGLHGCVKDPLTGEIWYAVRDFLLFTFGSYHWPVFNFADVFLVTGAIMLVVQSFMAERQAAAVTDSESESEAVDRPVKGSEPGAAVASVAHT